MMSSFSILPSFIATTYALPLFSEMMPDLPRYLGCGMPENRTEIEQIKRRIEYNELTSGGNSELPAVVRKIIETNHADYLAFFNKAGPISIRLHQLELIPGIGKKHMEQLLDERDTKPFADFEDIKKRVTLMQDPVHLLTQRIVEELQGNSKYYLFVRPPARKEEFGTYGSR